MEHASGLRYGRPSAWIEKRPLQRFSLQPHRIDLNRPGRSIGKARRMRTKGTVSIPATATGCAERRPSAFPHAPKAGASGKAEGLGSVEGAPEESLPPVLRLEKSASWTPSDIPGSILSEIPGINTRPTGLATVSGCDMALGAAVPRVRLYTEARRYEYGNSIPKSNLQQYGQSR